MRFRIALRASGKTGEGRGREVPALALLGRNDGEGSRNDGEGSRNDGEGSRNDE